MAAVPTERMYDLYSSYLESRLEACLELVSAGLDAGAAVASTSSPSPDASDRFTRKRVRPSRKPSSQPNPPPSQAPNAPHGIAVAAGAELLALYRTAHDASCASMGLYLRWMGWAERLGQPKMAGAVAKQACSRHPSSLELWACRLRLDSAARPAKTEPLKGWTSQVLETLKTAVKAIQPGVGGEEGSISLLWLQALEVILPQSDPEGLGRLVDLLELTVIKTPGSDIGRVVAAYLERIRCARKCGRTMVLGNRLRHQGSVFPFHRNVEVSQSLTC